MFFAEFIFYKSYLNLLRTRQTIHLVNKLPTMTFIKSIQLDGVVSQTKFNTIIVFNKDNKIVVIVQVRTICFILIN